MKNKRDQPLETKMTPGEWTMIDESSKETNDMTRWPFIIISDTKQAKIICKVSNESGYLSAKDNARCICMVPQLIQLAKTIFDQLSQKKANNNGVLGTNDAILFAQVSFIFDRLTDEA